jgi:hypothetical protein
MRKQLEMFQEEATDPAVPHPAPIARFDLPTLAGMLGQLQRKGIVDGEAYSALHLSTAVIHGWNKHEQNYGPLLLTVDEYTQALAATPDICPAADRR